MSKPSDNPLVRFTAFFWGIAVFSLFGVLVLVAWLFYGGKQNGDLLEEKAAAIRYGKRAEVEAAQAKNLDYKVVEEGKTVQVPPRDVFDLVGKHLVGTKAAPVEKPEQVVPGSKRQLDLASAPAAVDFAAVDKLTPSADTAIDPAQMAIGKTQFIVCSACHGMDGKGAAGSSPIAPPLEGSEWVKGPVSNLIRIQLRGLQGEVHVLNKVWPLPAPLMAPLAYQTDEQIAGVLTYVRNSFGNKAGPVLPEQVKMLRSEVGKPFLTEADLIKP
jgi:mono/diheme cytochrome c family protein